MSKNGLTLSTKSLRRGSTLAALLGPDETPSNSPSSEPDNRPNDAAVAAAAQSPARSGGDAIRNPAPSRKRTSESSTVKNSGDDAFWAVGILEQTSIAVDPELLAAIDATRRELSVPVATLFSAVVHAGLPADGDAAADVVLLEQADHPGKGREYNLRMPVGLKSRLDELVKAAAAQIGRATRADLVNASLRAAMPSGLDEARELFVTYQRQQTLARRPRHPAETAR